MDIVKLTVWYVPGQRERPERWDAEIVRTGNLRERVTGIPADVAERLVREITEVMKERKPTRTRSR